MDTSILEQKAKNLRRRVLDLGIEKREAHFGGCFSEAEILVSLYNSILKPEDTFILSKGHAYPALYVLLKDRGYDPHFATHPDIDEKNGIYATSGSLGHGLPIAIGRAMARKRLKKDGRIYVLMGDGECQEGTTWESALIASHQKLDNLTLIVDRNYMQALDSTEDILSLGDLGEKFEAFGWDTSNIDGHSFKELISSFSKNCLSKPHAIIANTIKGKGVSYMVGDPKWHTRLPNQQELKQAYEELK